MADEEGSSVEELPDLYERTSLAQNERPQYIPSIPALFTSLPAIKDPLITETSARQDETIEECLPYLTCTADPSKTVFDYSAQGVPRLERDAHVRFLTNTLQNAKHMAYDPLRPWIVYWTLTGLTVLGQDVSIYRQRVIETFTPAQNAGGGFGGGHGHLSHCAPSYAVILSLAMVGGSEALDLVDRRAMWHWLGQVKQADGGFKVCVGGEEDVRGAYCSLVMISLLFLPTELPPDAPARREGLTSLFDGLPDYLSRCQTFEGGISASPQTEAHGAFAFCVLAGLGILGPPHEMITKYLNLPLLISWLSARQYAPEGGFSGRTNKLVDGCYSHWVGGCWPLIEAALGTAARSGPSQPRLQKSLYSREGLIRYIASCCQADLGGLRDKPSIYPDAYHSCYVLAGLSSAQHHHAYCQDRQLEYLGDLLAALHWEPPGNADRIETSGVDRELYDANDQVEPLHPIYVIPWRAVEEASHHYRSKIGF